MAGPAIGGVEAVGLGLETVYGTGVADTVMYKPLSFNLIENDEANGSPAGTGIGNLFQYGYDATNPRAFLGMRRAEGDISMELEFDDVGFWLHNIMTNNSGYAADTPVASTYTHGFEAPTAFTVTMPKSLSIYHGNNIGAGHDIRFAGCHLESFSVSGSGTSGVPFTYTVGVLGQSSGASGATQTDITSTAPWAEYHNSGIWIDAVGTTPDVGDILGGASYVGEDVAGWTFTLTRPLRRPVKAASRLMRAPYPNDFMSAMFEFDNDWFSTTTFQAIMRASSTASRYRYVVAHIDSGSTYITGTTPYSLEIHMPAALFQGDMPTYGGGSDVVPQRIRCIATYDGTNPPVTIYLINGTSGATAYQ